MCTIFDQRRFVMPGLLKSLFMKYLFLPLFAVAWSTGALAWGWGDIPTCASTCINSFINSDNTGGGISFCQNATLVANVNSCVDTSSCSTSDKEALHQNITQLCTDIEAHSARSNSAWPTGGPWSGGLGIGGPFGGSWGQWRSSGAWTAGPWTSWWCGNACPNSDWPGWTSGAWSTGAPWTTWTACTATTTATTTYTTTSAGSVVTGVTYGIKVAQQTGTGTSDITTSDSPSSALTSKDRARMAFILLAVPFLVTIWG
ncbi:hypothetical protein B7463_g9801, partial [Scytalidium lignicola]